MTEEQVIQPDLAELLGDQSQAINFLAGLIGLDEWHKFAIISHPAGGPLQLLQSLEDQRVSFIITDPHHVLSDYRLKLTKADAEALQYTGPAGVVPADHPDITVVCILSMQEEPFSVSVNLLGPLVINWQSGLGRQVIQSDSNYSPRHIIADSDSAPPAEAVSPGKEGA